MRTDRLCPPLARLLDARWTIGLRNSGHTVAKLLDPFPAHSAVRVVNYTHPEYAHMHTAFLQHIGANAVLMLALGNIGSGFGRNLSFYDQFTAGGLTNLDAYRYQEFRADSALLAGGGLIYRG